MNICKSCGNEIGENEKFCRKCGAAAEVQTDYQSTYAVQGSAPYRTKSELTAAHKYFMIKFKRILALVMMVLTAGAIVAGLMSIAPLNSNYKSALVHGSSISYIESVGGKTLEEAYYKDYGKYLENEAAISYTTACLVSGIYQTVLLILLLYWVYLFMESSFKKQLYEETGEIE